MNKIGSFLKAIGKGAIAEIPVVGSLINTMGNAKNESSAHSPSGKTDYAHLIGVLMPSIIFAFLVLAYIMGWIDEETFKMLNSKNNIREVISN